MSDYGDKKNYDFYSISRQGVIEDDDRRQIMENGSLLLESVIGSDAANYTCRVENTYGSDVITYSVSVQGKMAMIIQMSWSVFTSYS